MKKEPYIIKLIPTYNYNPEYGDDERCRCGHSYYRHFDSYEDMYACGCKYCACDTFKEGGPQFTEEIVELNIAIQSLRGLLDTTLPTTRGNYFSLSCGSRVVNMWAENLRAANRLFKLEDTVKIRRYKGADYDVCFVVDGRLPYDWRWTNKELCFTGTTLPPVEVINDMYTFIGRTMPEEFNETNTPC